MTVKRFIITTLTASSIATGGIMLWEGKENTPYRDQAGLLTVGYGHLLTTDQAKTIYTDREIKNLLIKDTQRFVKCIHNTVKAPLTQYEFDTLVIFSYNIGCSAFKNSTLLKKLNQLCYSCVPKQLKRWNKVTIKGRKVTSRGLTNRREYEAKLWKDEIK